MARSRRRRAVRTDVAEIRDDRLLAANLRELAVAQWEMRGDHDHNPPNEQDGNCGCGQDGCPNDPSRRLRWAGLAIALLLENPDQLVREATRDVFEVARKQDHARCALEEDAE